MKNTYETQKELNTTSPSFDRDKIITAVKMLLEAIGDNPNREGLKETPDRVARMYEEVFEGMRFTNDQIAEMFNECFDEKSDTLVVVDHIPLFSYCEHHLALMYNMEVSVGYIPHGKVIGLSKVARIADMVGKRLQLQERIGTDIAYILKKILGTPDVIVLVEGEHSCMTTRGIKSRGAKTRTLTCDGVFKNDPEILNEFFNLCK